MFYLGLVLWLAAAIAETTLAWLFVPSSLGRLARYVALALVVGRYLIRSRAHPASLLVYLAFVGAGFALTRSTRFVKYSAIAFVPIADVVAARRTERAATSWLALTLSLLAMVVAVNAEIPTLVDLAVLIAASRGVPFKRIALVALVVTSIALLVVFLSCATGIMKDYLSDGGSDRARWFLGFSYALYPARYLFLLTCLVCCLSDAKLNVIELIALIVANWAVFALTDSRLAMGCALVVICFSVLRRFSHKNLLDFRWARRTAVALVVASVAAGILLPALFDGSIAWMASLNTALGGRLSLGHDALFSYGIAPFGQRIEYVGNGLTSLQQAESPNAYNYVDSLYVQLLLNYGPVFFAVYVLLQLGVLARAMKGRQEILVLVLIAFAVQGIIDDAAIYMQYNTFLLLAGGLFEGGSADAWLQGLQTFLARSRKEPKLVSEGEAG